MVSWWRRDSFLIDRRDRIYWDFLLIVNIKVRRKESLLFISFMNQIVNSCDLVMFVIINALLGEILFVPELLQHLKNLRFSRNMIFSYDKTLILANRLIHLKPSVFSDVLGSVPSVRICVKDLC
jgi:hypothetical protein